MLRLCSVWVDGNVGRKKCSHKTDFQGNVDILANKSIKNRNYNNHVRENHMNSNQNQRIKEKWNWNLMQTLQFLFLLTSSPVLITCFHLMTWKWLCQSNFRVFDSQSAITNKVNGRPEAATRGALWKSCA